MKFMDRLFAGEKGLTKTLTRMLAGEQIYVRLLDATFNEVTGLIDERTEEHPVDFAVIELKKHQDNEVDGERVLSGDIVGFVPATDIPFDIRRASDRIRINGDEYVIHAFQSSYASNEKVGYRLLCRQAKNQGQ